LQGRSLKNDRQLEKFQEGTMNGIGARNIGWIFGALAAMLGTALPAWAGPDRPTEFTGIATMLNTRHNLTQRNAVGGDLLAGGPNAGGAGIMDSQRQQFGQVCVFCHTPHGANAGVALPLWNRTIVARTYTTYDQLNTSTLTQTVSQPGVNSLSCLSCHDGQTAIDSIINMPGAGGYNAGQATNVDKAFLDSFSASPASHANMTECSACHSPTGSGAIFPTATDFSVFVIGTDLRNDHPVGITFPMTSPEFNGPLLKTKGTSKYFDVDDDNAMNGKDIRLYSDKVECASCHDPHGVPVGARSGPLVGSFLRVDNTGSQVCLTCHIK
jgi:hypothetical protein